MPPQEISARDIAGPELRTAIRRRHLAYTTEKAYMGWLRRFQAFLHPKEVMESKAVEVVNFLTYLAEEKRISPTGQNQCELVPPLIHQEFLEIFQSIDLMVSGQYGLVRNRFFHAYGLLSEKTYGVVGLESDTPRVDAAVTIRAGCLVTVNLKLFPDGKLFEVFHALFDAGNIGWGRFGGIMEQAFPDPYRPFDGMGVGTVRSGKLNRCMTQYSTGSICALKRDSLEKLGFRTF